jgi:hypothetical protein
MLTWRVAMQLQKYLPVRKPARQLVCHVDGERRLADSCHATYCANLYDRSRGNDAWSGIQQGPNFRVAAGEQSDISRKCAGRRGYASR